MGRKAWQRNLMIIMVGFILAGIPANDTVFASAGNSSGMESSSLLQGSKAVYYKASHSASSDFDRQGVIYNIVLKKNTIVTYGTFRKSSTTDYGKGKYCDNRRRVFKLAKNVRYYTFGGDAGKVRRSKSYIRNFCGIGGGLGFLMKVRNGKVVEVVFSS